MLKSVWKNRRYAPVKKWLLKALAKLVHCSGAGLQRGDRQATQAAGEKPKKRKRTARARQ